MTFRNQIRTAIGALMIAALPCAVAAQTVFSADEKETILSFGPWPERLIPDPTNRYSGKRDAVRLGAALFEDFGLSRTGQIACTTCHDPERHFADGRKRGIGTMMLERNTIALANLRLNRVFGWRGTEKTLWSQSMRPILSRNEMGMTAESVAARIGRDNDLSREYGAVFGAPPALHSADVVLENIAKALAAWQETLVTRLTPFDKFRDSLAADVPAGLALYPEDAKRGLKLFIRKANCTACHSGPNFTNGEIRDNGMGGKFRVPSLRNVANTGPYMHDGSMRFLRDVIDHHSGANAHDLKPVSLTNRETADLIAFLHSLSGGIDYWPR